MQLLSWMHAHHDLSMQISLTELRRTPGPALQHVRDGQEVVVTEAGIPLCRMVPIDQPTRYARLVAEGVIHAPTSPKEPSAIRGRSLASWAEAARAEASRDKKA